MEIGLLDACREAGTMLIEDGRVGEGWMYLRPTGDLELARKLISAIEITDGQLNFEFEILVERLERRSPEKHAELLGLRGAFSHPEPHPLFTVIEGEVGPWETSYWKRLHDAHSEP